MNDDQGNWLYANARQKGVLAAGIIFPDKTVTGQSFAHSFPLMSLENVWRFLMETSQHLSSQRLPATRINWLFEKALLQVCQRSDGAMLALITSRNPAGVDAIAIGHLFEEFELSRG
ncbi:MAG: hypothetical protein WCO56_21295 [Verrucomicrobiota bacterium]